MGETASQWHYFIPHSTTSSSPIAAYGMKWIDSGLSADHQLRLLVLHDHQPLPPRRTFAGTVSTHRYQPYQSTPFFQLFNFNFD